MDLRDFNHAAIRGAGAQQLCRKRAKEVRISLVFSVEDSEGLWTAAAMKALSTPGMRLDDVIDVIGPREDPAIAECIAMLAQPAPMPGCDLERFDVGPVSEFRQAA